MIRLIPALLASVSLLSAAPVPLDLSAFREDSNTLRPVEPDTYELHPGSPILAVPRSAPPEVPLVLEFEYFSLGGARSFHVLPGPPFEAKSAVRLDPPGHRETWAPYRGRLQPLPEGWTQLRLDLVLPEGRTLRIRHARLRPERPGEFDTRPTTAGFVAPDRLDAEFRREYPARLDRVSVGSETLRIEGRRGGQSGTLAIAEIPMDRLLDDPARFEVVLPIPSGPDDGFSLELPRFRDRSGHRYDRLVSRWRVVRQGEAGIEPLSHARYAEDVSSRLPVPPAGEIHGKKGLGGWFAGPLPGELERLGISAVTVNVLVDRLLAPGPGDATFPFEWQGRTYHARRNVLEEYDRTFRQAAEHGAVVSAILLVHNPARANPPQRSRLAHPGARPEGTYAMPDVTSEEGIAAYGAVLDLMAGRWSHADGRHGRVHHWIIHNEVDAGWVWTNAGDLPGLSYMDLYQRSMRLTDLITRQYDPHARSFISLTHHWAHAGQPQWYGSRRMLGMLARFTAAEGDFPWALAYHPYPQDLRNPRTWEDDQATFSFDTAKVTPRNLEVLDAWMKRPAMRYHGKVRPVHLSENGFNSPDYSETSLRDQAAGMAYAWKKIQPLSSIEVWHYHNWIDNRQEGGLRIGLRRFGDDGEEPHGPKPIWHVYEALGTDREDTVCAPYLEPVGLTDWSQAIHRGAIR